MKKKIWAAAAALTVAALSLPYGAAFAAADTTPEIKAEVTKATSSSRQTSSEVNVGGTWAVEKLSVGQSFAVSTLPTNGGAPFVWQASFPFTLDDGTKIGNCEADEATLTCKVTEIPAGYADKTNVRGTWWARARLQNAAVGTNEGTITLNGETVKKLVWGDKEGTGECTNDCDSPAHYEYANPENIKFGWTNANGTISWGIKWITKGGVEYTVKDFDAKLGKTVKCAKSDTWNPDTTEVITATQVDDNTIKFTAPEGSKTCVTYPPEQTVVPEGQTSVTNHAEINGMKLEATAEVKSNGGTDGDGSVKPTPAPAPTPSEDPKPTPSAPSTPKPEPSAPAPAPSTDPTPTPEPTPDTVKPTPTTEPTTQPTTQTTAPAPQERLAKTGATTNGLLLMIGAIMGGAGAGLLLMRLLEGPARKKETEL